MRASLKYSIFLIVLSALMLALSACGPGTLVADNYGLRVSVDTTHHVACYHYDTSNNIACVRVDR